MSRMRTLPDSVAMPGKHRWAVCMYLISLVKFVIYQTRNSAKYDRTRVHC